MAHLSLGIIGLPNVGKSTLFRALTSVAVPVENYPFCTIEPNVGVVEVPDPRLDRIHALVDEDRTRIGAIVEFVDIAGLVEGASRGEGLGNRFLHHVREADALVHVIRGFEDEAVVRTGGASTDPIRDRALVQTELALADLDTVTRRRGRVEKRARSGDRDAARELAVLERLESALNRGEPARTLAFSPEETLLVRELHLLTGKPTLYVLNADEAALAREATEGWEVAGRLRRHLAGQEPDAPCLVLCAELEAEIAGLPEEERREYLALLGLAESGLHRLIRTGYRLLGLRTFFTIGESEVRAWTVRAGARAPEAAGRVHTDFQRGFIRAEVVSFEDFAAAGSMKAARQVGTLRLEGKEYVVQDGDILFFRTSA